MRPAAIHRPVPAVRQRSVRHSLRPITALAVAAATAAGLGACTTAPGPSPMDADAASTTAAEDPGTVEEPQEDGATTAIRFLVDGTELEASLQDHQAASDFAAMLPLELSMSEYAGNEIMAYLPESLSTRDAPSGYDPEVGDLCYFAPWGTLAIFYEDFGYADGLVKLGAIEGDLELLTSQEGEFTATVEPAS
jgi:hypothetical protein